MQKLSQERLELRVLKHIISSPKAMPRAKMERITLQHFAFKREGSEECYTGRLFFLAEKYYDMSGGMLLTENTLESKMVEAEIKPADRKGFLLTWSDIQEEDCDDNELFDLLRQLKNRLAMRLWREAPRGGNEEFDKNGLEGAVSYVQKCLEEIQEQLTDDRGPVQREEMVDGLDDYLAAYKDAYDNPDRHAPIPLGLRVIDDQIGGLLPGDLAVFVAPSSGGKSVQLLNAAHKAHHDHGKRVLYLSLEMDLAECRRRWMALRGNVSYYDLLHHRLHPRDLKEVMEAIREEGGEGYLEMDAYMGDPSPEYVEARIRELTATRGKPDLVVIDYIGIMCPRGGEHSGKKQWEKTGDCIVPLLAIARRHGLAVLTAQQTNRTAVSENRARKADKQTAVYYQDCLSGDQRLVHSASYVIATEADKTDRTYTYYPVKMRRGHFEPFLADYYPDTMRIVDLEPEVQQQRRKAKGLVDKEQTRKSRDMTDEEVMGWITSYIDDNPKRTTCNIIYEVSPATQEQTKTCLDALIEDCKVRRVKQDNIYVHRLVEPETVIHPAEMSNTELADHCKTSKQNINYYRRKKGWTVEQIIDHYRSKGEADDDEDDDLSLRF